MLQKLSCIKMVLGIFYIYKIVFLLKQQLYIIMKEPSIIHRMDCFCKILTLYHIYVKRMILSYDR